MYRIIYMLLIVIILSLLELFVIECTKYNSELSLDQSSLLWLSYFEIVGNRVIRVVYYVIPVYLHFGLFYFFETVFFCTKCFLIAFCRGNR